MKQTDKKKFEKKVAVITWVRIIILLLVIGLSISMKIIDFEKIIPEKYLVFILGLIMAVILLDIATGIKYFRAKDKDGLEAAFIAQTDERNTLIRDKTGGKAINIVILGLLFAGIIGSLFNEIVFWTLIGAAVFTAIIKLIFKIYYHKHL